MSRLNEVLAVEKTLVSASNKLQAETMEKFKKDNYFKGHVKSLKMIDDSPENQVLEASSNDIRELPTNVVDTLEYMFKYWSDAEDIIFQKNLSNLKAISDIEYKGKVIATGIPVDELMGLESRLEALRKLFDNLPTLDATKSWSRDPQKGNGVWVTSKPEVTTKTEKKMIPVILHEATKEHPAQVKESSKDEVVGSWNTTHISGAITSAAKANILATTDELIKEIKKARTRANSVEASTDKIGKVISSILLANLTEVN